MRIHMLAPLVVGTLGACASDVPTAASDVEPSRHETHTGPGSTGPDHHSKNVKLRANVGRSNARTQSDLAFGGRYAYAGNYGGFRVLDISEPAAPVVVADVACNGAQGDVSVYGNLLFQSVDAPQSDGACTSTDLAFLQPDLFEGIRIFDISDPARPQHVASISTDCGSHTNTLVPDPANGRVLVYVSSYPGAVDPGPPYPCRPPHGYISIVDVPLSDPASATVIRHHLGATQPFGGSRVGCHDITVFLEIKRAAAACLSESQLWDITNPRAPTLVWRLDHPDVEIWHSAAFSWDGKIIAFGDESGGGGEARCTDPNDLQGRIWFVDVVTGAIRASYKIPRSEAGVCTAHNFNFISQRKGRKVLVSAWYTGGTSIVDVDMLLAGATSAEAEVGFYRPSNGRTWSSYWYDGWIYTNDMTRGVDVMRLNDNARAAAKKLRHLNPQTQDRLIY